MNKNKSAICFLRTDQVKIMTKRLVHILLTGEIFISIMAFL